MWKSEVVKNGENNQIEKIIFDFGYGITLVADAEAKSLYRYHGGILVKEHSNCIDLDTINIVVNNICEEIKQNYGGSK